MTGQQRLEALLRAARVYETHDMALAAPEVQTAMREMAPLVERDPVREMAYAMAIAAQNDNKDEWLTEPGEVAVFAKNAAQAADNFATAIDDELARLRAARKPPIK